MIFGAGAAEEACLCWQPLARNAHVSIISVTAPLDPHACNLIPGVHNTHTHTIADLVHHRLDESELKMEDLSTADAHDEDHDNDCDLIAELRASTIDFEEVLKMKIGTKGATLADMKKRMEDQKNLIIKLREGPWPVLCAC
jgi:hypothetical protein